MKVLTILGSPHKNGSTATALGWMEEELRAAGHTVDRINLYEHRVNDCIACYTCRTTADYTGCALKKDDGNELLERMVAADAVVLSSALYCWSFTAQTHAFLNRGFSLVKDYGMPGHRSRIQGKPMALLMTCGGALEDNADLVGPMFERIVDFTRAKNAGRLIIPGCMLPAGPDPSYREKAKKLAKALVA